MIVARTSSLIQPSAKPAAGLMTRVARAVTPTGQHEGRASNIVYDSIVAYVERKRKQAAEARQEKQPEQEEDVSE